MGESLNHWEARFPPSSYAMAKKKFSAVLLGGGGGGQLVCTLHSRSVANKLSGLGVKKIGSFFPAVKWCRNSFIRAAGFSFFVLRKLLEGGTKRSLSFLQQQAAWVTFFSCLIASLFTLRSAECVSSDWDLECILSKKRRPLCFSLMRSKGEKNLLLPTHT